MVQSRLKDNQSRENGAEKKARRFRFELSFSQLVLYSLGMILTLTWMFVFGILVGRGLPLVDKKDGSYRAALLRFMGLGREVVPPPENAAETWENPRKMLESLRYYQDLADGGKPSSSSSKIHKDSPDSNKSSARESASEATAAKSKPDVSAQNAAQEISTTNGEKADSSNGFQETNPAGSTGEHFTLLIASLREPENAQRLLDQLKAKGYDSRMEALDLSDSGRWNRVLVGSFATREEALRFATEFNRKEHMEGLVIRESN